MSDKLVIRVRPRTALNTKCRYAIPSATSCKSWRRELHVMSPSPCLLFFQRSVSILPSDMNSMTTKIFWSLGIRPQPRNMTRRGCLARCRNEISLSSFRLTLDEFMIVLMATTHWWWSEPLQTSPNAPFAILCSSCTSSQFNRQAALISSMSWSLAWRSCVPVCCSFVSHDYLFSRDLHSFYVRMWTSWLSLRHLLSASITKSVTARATNRTRPMVNHGVVPVFELSIRHKRVCIWLSSDF